MDKYPGLRRVLLGGGVAFFLLFLFLTYQTATDVLAWRKLDNDGVTIQAAISDKFAETGIRGGNKITYQFSVGGQTYVKTINVAFPKYETLAVGQYIEVLYVPSDPDVNDLADGKPQNLTGSILLVSFFGIVGAVLITVAFPSFD